MYADTSISGPDLKIRLRAAPSCSPMYWINYLGRNLYVVIQLVSDIGHLVNVVFTCIYITIYIYIR